MHEQKIPSAIVGNKLNQWYRLIREFEVSEAEALKLAVKEELDMMEENQDLLLYFSLLEFRHELMLSVFLPEGSIEADRSLSELLEQIEANQQKLTGLLDYYYYFFRGMYEYRNREIMDAIASYQKAESMLYVVEDKIEKAEFYYKLAEIYCDLHQTFFSMNYANQAMDIYKQFELYGIRRAECAFIFARNLMRVSQFDKAVEHLQSVLRQADELGKSRLKAASFYYLGKCSAKENKLEEAVSFFQQAAAVSDAGQTRSFKLKSILGLTHIRFRQGLVQEAAVLFEQGMQLAKDTNNQAALAAFQTINGLYIKNDPILVVNAFHELELRKLYAVLEELAWETAAVYHKREQHQDAVFFYNKAIEVQKLMQENIVFKTAAL
ncbi:RapJ protein [Bacillus atrophaeus]|uniref:response regulator aspartate phosphatase n=1 Tax=Bacillus atrophaeus TaxID=1452 RepID=UPI002281AC8B|nr:RapJ protein [Bacillus atrophaeus]MCY9136064.1 RapJ protein [Bacillus atrophaeus]MDL5143426.1 RapJ protein [Bacillus atrophaeus]